ncbi:unnamed protein product [Hymenolepis diminuta]|uniref:Uncharacterized protein n=1 Tax=Hymenolepis diminuta TaxID=6216 RepID=A0A564Z768_HYMDI|nr:unnamed protein product [Hymenolepis diminuta]
MKGIEENSDYDCAKPSILNLLSLTEKLRPMGYVFTRKQQPGDSYAQFAMALQAILAESTESTEQILSRRSGHAGIVELINAVINFTTTLGNRDQLKIPPRPNIPIQPKISPYRHPKPTQAIRSKYETVRMYTLNSGNCPVL